MFTIDAGKLQKGDSNNLTSIQKEDIDIVLRDYGDKEGYWLREQTHNESPWKDARGDLPDGAPSNEVITQDAMGAYYGSL